MAKIKNMHYTICLKVISSSAQVALPPAFAPLEQRGGISNYIARTSRTLGGGAGPEHIVLGGGQVLSISSKGKFIPKQPSFLEKTKLF